MHVVAQVGDDEREVRERVGAEVPPERRERDDPPQPPRARGDVLEVEQRIVLLRVAAGRRTREARRRQSLCIGLPRLSGPFERVREVPCRDDTARAVARHPFRRARDEREVVGQARVGDPVVVGQEGIASGECGECRRLAASDHLRELLVLEDDDHDTVRCRDSRCVDTGCSGREPCDGERQNDAERRRGRGLRRHRSRPHDPADRAPRLERQVATRGDVVVPRTSPATVPSCAMRSATATRRRWWEERRAATSRVPSSDVTSPW